MNESAVPVNLLLPPMEMAMPIHVIGDSNTLAYRLQTLSAPQYFARPIVTVVHYFPEFSAHGSFSGDKLNPHLDAYIRDPIFSRGVSHRNDWRGVQPDVVRLQRAKGRERPISEEFNYVDNPVVVLCVGALDLAWVLSELGPGVDFHLDDPRFHEAAFAPQAHTRVSSDAVRELCRARIAPLEHALARLVGLCFERLYVRSLHPPTLEDIAYFRMRRVLTSAVQRYKVTLLLNTLLREAAERAGARFLDTWDETTRDGVVRPELVFDPDHLNRAAAELTLAKLLGDLVARRSAPLDPIDRFRLS
jgi:hypothetical protein